MKKIAILLTVLTLSLTSCLALNGTRIDRLFDTNEQVANKRLETILDALKRQDKATLKSMFSATALAEAVDFDEHLDYLLEFFQGDVLSWKAPDGIGGGHDVENGLHTKRIDARYIVETDKDKYIFIFVDYPVDDINPDHKGLYALRVLRKEDEDTEANSLVETEKSPGIYKPTQTTDDENYDEN